MNLPGQWIFRVGQLEVNANIQQPNLFEGKTLNYKANCIKCASSQQTLIMEYQGLAQPVPPTVTFLLNASTMTKDSAALAGRIIMVTGGSASKTVTKMC